MLHFHTDSTKMPQRERGRENPSAIPEDLYEFADTAESVGMTGTYMYFIL
jgi:hypothetical protein